MHTAVSILDDSVPYQYAPVFIFLALDIVLFAVQLIFHNKERRIYDGKENPGVLLDETNGFQPAGIRKDGRSLARDDGGQQLKYLRDATPDDLADLSDDPGVSFGDMLQRDRDRVLDSVRRSKFKAMIEVTDLDRSDS